MEAEFLEFRKCTARLEFGHSFYQLYCVCSATARYVPFSCGVCISICIINWDSWTSAGDVQSMKDWREILHRHQKNSGFLGPKVTPSRSFSNFLLDLHTSVTSRSGRGFGSPSTSIPEGVPLGPLGLCVGTMESASTCLHNPVWVRKGILNSMLLIEDGKCNFIEGSWCRFTNHHMANAFNFLDTPDDPRVLFILCYVFRVWILSRQLILGIQYITWSWGLQWSLSSILLILFLP